MSMSRRQFAQSLGAGIVLLPFLKPSFARAAAGTGPSRLIFMTSLGIAYDDWAPTSAAGSPVVLGPACQGLKSVVDDVMFVGGLPGVFPGENHGTAQHTTGLDFGHTNQRTSVETYIASQLKPSTKLPTLLLGASAKSGSSFFQTGNSLPTTDSPLDAYNLAFGAGTAMPTTTTGAGFNPPRGPILDLVQAQLKSLQGSMGSAEKAKLDQHLQAVQTLENTVTGKGTATTGGTMTACQATAPNLNGANPGDQASTAAIGALQMQLIPTILACGVTNIVGMQWGITNAQIINAPGASGDEHSNVHSGSQADAAVCAQDNAICSAFAAMVTALKQTPDPSGSGKTMLDDTLVVWTRDIGNGPDHTQAKVPFVLAGATSYLKYSASGGTYYDLSSSGGTTLNMLLTMIDAMGAPIGSFASTSGGAQTGKPLSEIKA